MKKLTALTVVLALAAASQAAVISVNFASSNTGDGGASVYYGDTGSQGLMAATDVAGVVPASNWTNATGLDPTATDLVDDSGATTTMDLGLVGDGIGGWMMGEASYTSPSSADATMMYAARAVGGVEEQFDIELTEIPYGVYDLYVYVGRYAGWTNPSGDTGQTTVDGTTYHYYRSDPDGSMGDLPGAHVQAMSTDVNNPTAGATYVLFEGLTGSSQTISQFDDNGDELGITGIQVVEVPEPATMSLLALGGLAVLRRRRRA